MTSDDPGAIIEEVVEVVEIDKEDVAGGTVKLVPVGSGSVDIGIEPPLTMLVESTVKEDTLTRAVAIPPPSTMQSGGKLRKERIDSHLPESTTGPMASRELTANAV